MLWTAVVPEEDVGGDPDEYIDRLVDPHGEGPTIWCHPVPGRKTVKTPFHLFILVTDRSGPMEEVDAKVAGLVDLGATIGHPDRVDPQQCGGTTW